MPRSFLDALEARPATLAALAAVLLLALGHAPAQAGMTATICTTDGVKEIPLDDGSPRRDIGAASCAHACLPRERRRG